MTMYENLLRLPYLQGMSQKELTAILDKVKLNFTRYNNGEKILNQNEDCENFTIIIQGKMMAEHKATDNSYKLSEEIEAPFAIEPYSLFGSEHKYYKSYIAINECSLLTISKSYFYSDFLKHSIFTMNLLNLISRKVQLQNSLAWMDTPTEIENKIAYFIATRSETLTGKKSLKIKMTQLAQQLDVTRINVSRALNNLEKEGIISLSRGEILIPKFESLFKNQAIRKP